MDKNWREYSKFILYGTGSVAIGVYDILKSEGFWDNDKVFVFDRSESISQSQNKKFMNLPVIPREEIGKYLNSDVAVLIASLYVDDIIDHLIKIQNNFLDYNIYVPKSLYSGGGPCGQRLQSASEKILPFDDISYQKLQNLLCDENSYQILNNIIMYRNTRIDFVRYDAGIEFGIVEDYWESIKPSTKFNKAIVIDGGAYAGNSILPICSAINQFVHKYYAFEPGITAYEMLNSLPKSSSGKYELLIPINKGLSDSEETILFNDCNMESSIIWDQNNCNAHVNESCKICEINTTTIDALDLEPGYDIYIKLDIEGSEMRALKGAEKLIRERKPNLAICLYHKPNDIVEIPIYLKSLVPEYKIYLVGNAHTICIAKI